jgi:hypothetical protein
MHKVLNHYRSKAGSDPHNNTQYHDKLLITDVSPSPHQYFTESRRSFHNGDKINISFQSVLKESAFFYDKTVFFTGHK